MTSGSVQDFPSFLKDAGEQLEWNPARGPGFFGKSNFISTNMRKMKTNTAQTANYHPLGPLSPIFSPRDTKWPIAARAPHVSAGRRLPPLCSVRETAPRRPGDGQVDAPLAPVIFQTHYFTWKVINYTTDTSLVSCGPCGLNQRQILCH